MTRDELLERLKAHEWRDIEFKEASFAVPRDVYSTVSAFANTEGGYIIFGVKKADGAYEIKGVIHDSVDEVQNGFLTGVRDRNKMSAFVAVKESKIEDPDGTILIFYIPESPRQNKPVHLNRELRESYVRRGGTDQHCTEEEIKRLIRDAADVPFDSEPMEDIPAAACFDEEVLHWYRAEMNRRQPGRHETLNDLEFLNEWGFVVEKQGQLIPTRACILVFGKGKYVRQILPRCVVDYQRSDFNAADWSPEARWSDRIVVDENLIRAWWQLVERFMKMADKPFSLDMATLRRDDEPPEYISFREAAINLLIHQDYGDFHRLPYLYLFRDQSVFYNPGDNFHSEDRLLDPGAKDVRNPKIVDAFRRIGLSDQAGTGFRAIFKNWHRLGNVPPDMVNDKAEKTFKLILRRIPLISEKQRILQATLGVHLSEAEAESFAYACQRDRLTTTDVRALTGSSPADAKAILDRLTVQMLLKPVDADAGIFELQDQFKTKQLDLSTGQVPAETPDLPTGQVKPLAELDDKQWAILRLCFMARSMKELLEGVGLSSRDFFITKYLQPLISAGLVVMTLPDSPRAPTQRYILSKKGLELHAWYIEKEERHK